MNPAPDRLVAALQGRYAVGPTLGAGGMAAVYRARDEKHGRDVALKVLRPEVSETLGRERFLHEIRMAAGLTHPHILPLHDSGDAGGVLWFTAQLRALLAGIAGRRDEALAVLATVNEASLDAHHTFHLSESYAAAGAHDRAVDLLDRAVTMGFWTAEYYRRFCPFFQGLRDRADFQAVVARAAERAAAFRV